ncbi:unnamed protein product [Sphagnum jensenii]|uniref:Secreted protein n=1 Tax=Sphagnum jensenii TaxID=128206 RepID=A0ABP1BJE6_9BRYO
MKISTEMCIILIRLLFRYPHHHTSIDPAKGASTSTIITTTTSTRTPRAAAATQQYLRQPAYSQPAPHARVQSRCQDDVSSCLT